MFGFGKKKVTQVEFEGELTRLLTSYQDWQGGDNPDAKPALVARFSEFKRIAPDRKASERLSRLLRDLIENQVKAMSYLSASNDKRDAGDFAGAFKEYRTGQTHLAKTNRAAEVLVGDMEALEESDPVRKILVDGGFYVPTGDATPSTVAPASSEERSLAVSFLRTLQWCSARQQLAMEEWNDALVVETGARPGDELSPSPPVALTALNAPRLLPIADRRLAHARAIKEKFASLEMLPQEGEGTLGIIAMTVRTWAEAFSIYERRCEATAHDLQSLIHGTPASSIDEPALAIAESQAIERAVVLQRKMMETTGIGDPEFLFLEALNELRRELGKAPISTSEFARLYECERPRFFTDGTEPLIAESGVSVARASEEPTQRPSSPTPQQGERYCSNCRRFLAGGASSCGYCGHAN